jgi:hypothetical protein
MDILNKKERLSAFLLFLLMFFITTAVLIAALFYNFKLPMKVQFAFQKQFSEKIEEITTMVDSLDKAPESFQFIEQKINFELVALNEKIPADTDQELKVYDNTILIIKNLVNAKKMLLQGNDSKKEIDLLNNQIKSYEEENKDLIRDLEMLRQLNNRRP